MTTQPQPASLSELEAEHETLKQQTAALRREHNRLQTEGGTTEERRHLFRK
jgi:prefoldin subunit 5